MYYMKLQLVWVFRQLLGVKYYIVQSGNKYSLVICVCLCMCLCVFYKDIYGAGTGVILTFKQQL